MKPGQIVNFKFNIRISEHITANQTEIWKYLFEPMKIRTTDIKPSIIPTVQFAEFDFNWIRKDNPFGYYDNNGQDKTLRFDLGFDLWNKILEKLKIEKVIYWQIGGYHNSTPGIDAINYLIDPMKIPDVVKNNIPSLIQKHKELDIQIGGLLRPSQSTYNSENYIEIKEYGQLIEDLTNIKIDYCIDNLGQQCFYLDSYGFGNADLEIAKLLRKKSNLLFAEHPSDWTFKYVGGYTKYVNGGFAIIGEQIKMLQYLNPNMPIIIRDDEHPNPIDKVKFAQSQGMSALLLYKEALQVPELLINGNKYEEINE